MIVKKHIIKLGNTLCALFWEKETNKVFLKVLPCRYTYTYLEEFCFPGATGPELKEKAEVDMPDGGCVAVLLIYIYE
jgi:hypothetical protein